MADGTVGAGACFVEASTLAGAFSNPLHFDWLQVVNKDGKVVWNLTADGSTNLNRTSPTTATLLGKFVGATFAQAFAQNPLRYDVFQVVGPSGAGIFHVHYTGAVYSD